MSRTHATNRQIYLFLAMALVIFAALLWRICTTWDLATGTELPVALEPAMTAARELHDIETLLEKKQAQLGRQQAADQAAASPGGAAPDAPAASGEDIRAEIAGLTLRQAAVISDIKDKAYLGVRSYVTNPVTESRVIYMVMLLGALGGASHFLGSFVKFVGNRQLRRSWLPHYISLPFVGAALAVFVYLLLRVGLVVPNGQPGQGTSLSSLNLIAIYAFSALTGMFSGPATEKLGEIFRTMFKTDHASKDALPKPSEKPPGPRTP